ASVDAYEQLGIQADKTRRSTEQIAQSTRETAGYARRGTGMMTAMTGVGVMFTGMQIQQVGQAMLQPIQAYVKYADMAEESSRDWLENQRRLEQSTIRIGKNMAEALEPYEKAKLDVMELISRSKILSTIGAGIGATAQAGGTALMIGGQALSAYGAVESLKYLKEMAVASQAATAAATANTGAKLAETTAGSTLTGSKVIEKVTTDALVTAKGREIVATNAGASKLLLFGKGLLPILGKLLPVVGGIAIGSALSKPIAPAVTKAVYGEEMEARPLGDFFRIFGEALVVGWSGAVNVFTKDADRARQSAYNLAQSLGLLSNTADNTVVPTAVLDAYIDYQKRQSDAVEQYERQRTETVEQYARERAQLEADYGKERSKMMRDFGLSQAEAAEDFGRSQVRKAAEAARSENEAESGYYERRSRMLEDYHIDLQRMEEDHQRRMQQRQMAHNDRVADLVDQRDALGLWREMRDHERERKAAEEDYSITVGRKDEDLARRLAEMEADFAAQRQKRTEERQRRAAEEAADFAYRMQKERERFEERIAEFDAQHVEQLKQMEGQKRERLGALSRQHTEELRKMRDAFGQQLIMLDSALGSETRRRAEYYAYWQKQFEAYAKNITGIMDSAFRASTTGVKGGRASGGYVSSGVWRLHDDEYVLTAQTTRMLEQQAGGNLTQGKIQTMLTMNANRQMINVAPQITINGLMDKGMTQKIYTIAKQATVDAVTEALR
ncbi:MAG TPA: hypothetical protein VLH56_05265, partial [Dissulfurispiraceae bacterium]|nr:hypothetical protein [Dissulfurispiraceae bacterium]